MNSYTRRKIRDPYVFNGINGIMGSTQYLQVFRLIPRKTGDGIKGIKLENGSLDLIPRARRWDQKRAPMGSKARGMGSMQLAQIQAVTNTDPIDPIDPNKKQ